MATFTATHTATDTTFTVESKAKSVADKDAIFLVVVSRGDVQSDSVDSWLRDDAAVWIGFRASEKAAHNLALKEISKWNAGTIKAEVIKAKRV